MKILITGASGFVGTNLLDYLKPSNEVDSLSIRYSPNQELNLKVDAIIHLAGKAHDLKKVSNPQDYYDSNFELTKQLFDAFLQSEASVFVFMSTVKAVADVVNETLTEMEVCNPITHYGIAKQQAENYLMSQELPKGKRVFILRPCMIHGHGNKGNLNVLFKLVSIGLPWPLGAFDNQRSFLSVENLCFVIQELLVQETIPSGIYNVADDESLSTNELIELIAQSQNKKARILSISPQVIQGIAKIGDVLHLPLNSARLKTLTESYVVSNAKIVNTIGKSLPENSKTGLLKTFWSFAD
ncbi:NAD-dependent epimerase/dehydratase family protein [Flavobacterium sp.]|uniref:NAD-dependent epimerase/dehydratase family protein n=1 Tax=Flavobacterium sp. TaxID=239 RepID=UPI00286DBF1A|nr:NAD-dependent epimerase/dehydratase family protein [Flavobacterium sp.]